MMKMDGKHSKKVNGRNSHFSSFCKRSRFVHFQCDLAPRTFTFRGKKLFNILKPNAQMICIIVHLPLFSSQFAVPWTVCCRESLQGKRVIDPLPGYKIRRYRGRNHAEMILFTTSIVVILLLEGADGKFDIYPLY